MKSKLEIYALAVCFAAVVCVVVSAGIGGYALVKIAAPELTIERWFYERHQSNDAYWEAPRPSTSESKKTDLRPSEDELTKRRTESYAHALTAERREGLQTLIKAAMFLFAGLVALWVHWRISQYARKDA